jgi:hypothetical protein
MKWDTLVSSDTDEDDQEAESGDEYRPDVDDGAGCAEMWEAIQAARDDE